MRYILLLTCFFVTALAAQEPQLMLPVGHNTTIKFLQVSADNKYLLSCSEDNTLIVWEKNTGRIVRRVHYTESGIVSGLLVPGDNSLLLLFANGRIVRSELASGKLIYQQTVTAPVNEMIINGNDLLLYYKKVFLGIGNALFGKPPMYDTVEIRNINTGRLITTVKGRYALDLHAEDKLIAIANHHEINIYDDQYRLQKRIVCPAEVLSLKFMNDDIICTTNDNTLLKINAAGNIQLLYTGVERLKGLQVSPGSNKVFTGCLKKLAVINTHDTSLNYHFGFVSEIEDISLDASESNLLHFVLANGHTGYFDHTTKKGGFLQGQAGWNNKIIAAHSKELYTYGDDPYFIRWRTAPFSQQFTYTGHTSPVSYINYDSTKDRLLVQLAGKPLMMRDGKTLAAIHTNLPAYRPIYISPLYEADSVMIIAYPDNKLYYYDYRTAMAFDSLQVAPGTLQEEQITGGVDLNEAILVDGGTTIQVVGRNKTVLFWDAENKLINSFVTGYISGVLGSIHHKYVILKTAPVTVLKKSAEGASLDVHAELPVSLELSAFSHDENSLIYTETNKYNTVSIFNLEKNELRYSQRFSNYILALSNSNENNVVAAATIDSLMLFDVYNGKLIRKMALNNGGTTVLRWKNNNTLITGNEDGMVTYMDIKTGKILLKQLLFDDGASMVMNADKYYMGDRSKVNLLHYVNPDLQVISFDQLDLQYNRPDLILKSLEKADTALISSYYKAYAKRLRRAGVDTGMLTKSPVIPEADFSNRDDIAFEQTNERLTLSINATDNSATLEQFNLWINDVPLFGAKGIRINRQGARSFDTVITVNLQQGLNTIETTVRNRSGMESYKMPLVVNLDAPAQPKLHFIGIGIDEFYDSSHNLRYCVKDIHDLAERLKKKHGTDILIDTLFNSSVTAGNIQQLKQKLLNTSVNDKVIVAYSGHGLLSKDYEYYLSTWNVNFNDPAKGGLPYQAFESLLDGIPARSKLVLIDACHSGEIDKEEMAEYERVRATLNNSEDKAKSTITLKPGKKTLGSKNTFELMKELFVDVSKSTGTTIIAAAAATQFAIERADIKNGVFTYCILELMQQKESITIDELKTYLNLRVPYLTNGLQRPATRSETGYGKWRIW